MSANPREVGVIGFGNLGRAMATALAAAGWTVHGYDRRPEALRELPAEVNALASPSDVGGCPVLALVVSDDEAVEQVLFDDGALAALPDGAVVAVHSTILPATAKRLGELVGDRVALVEAPVSGGAERAAAGQLTVMAGGAVDDVERARDYLDTVASSAVHTGELGSASAVKLGNQLMMFAALAATHEAIDLATAYGAGERELLAAVRHGTGDCWVAREWGFFPEVAADYDRTGLPVRYRPWSKDLWDVVAAARTEDVTVPVAGLLAQLMAERVEGRR